MANNNAWYGVPLFVIKHADIDIRHSWLKEEEEDILFSVTYTVPGYIQCLNT